jgi:16S rRNA (guanine527-N7)-methyltransferase
MAHDFLKKVIADAGYDLGDDRIEAMARYLERLERDRERFDLTAIREPGELARRQVGESLALLVIAEELGLSPGARLSDVGSGGGAPGIPIAIARPDLEVILIESSTRKAAWLSEIVGSLRLHASVLPVRAEEAGRDPAYRERSDVVVAKAVAALPTLLELTIPLLKPGGILLAPKGSQLRVELEQSDSALFALGAEVVDRRPLADADRSPVVLIIRKMTGTHDRYPRFTAAIRKRPLGDNEKKA